MLDVELAVASLPWGFRCYPGSPPASQFFISHIQVEPSSSNIQFNEVAVFDQRQRPTHCRFRRHMEHHRPVSRTAHSSIRDANHVGDALLQYLGREGHIANFGHSRIAARAAVLQYHYATLVHFQSGIIDPGVEVFDVLEHDGAAAMRH
jgi:hypothetical protein